MEHILDHEEQPRNLSKRFSWLSFIFSIINLCVFGYIIYKVLQPITANEGIPSPTNGMIIFMRAIFLFGGLMAVISFVRKEPSSFPKWFGGIINILVIIILITSYIIYRI